MLTRALSAAVATTAVAALVQVGTSGTASAGPEPATRAVAATGTSYNHALSPQLARLARSATLQRRSPAAQARALSLPAHGAGSLLRRGDRLMVQIPVRRTGRAEVRAIRRAGARIVHVSQRYATVTALVGYGRLLPVSRVSGVRSVAPVLTPELAGVGSSTRSAAKQAARSGAAPVGTNATCPRGNATTEGLTQLRADLEQAQLGGTGAGVTVGVLSDSYGALASPTSPAQDVASGDLPGTGNPCGQTTPVNVVADYSGGEDEGRAMLQVVHDLAPDAHLAFATAYPSDTVFADHIRALAASGAKVIVDDVSYFDEPFYQDGPIADAVNDVTAQGVVYYSSAANNNIISAGKNVGSWEAPAYRPTTCPTAAVNAGDTSCQDFDPTAGVDNTYGITVSQASSLRLEVQWAEPWYGVSDRFDVMLLNSGGTAVCTASRASQPQAPFAIIACNLSAGTYNLVIGRYSGSGTPRIKLAFLQNGLTAVLPSEYTSSNVGDVVGPTIYGHNGAQNAVSVAAVPYNNSAAPEYYSSRGPVTLLFGPVNGTTPAAALASPLVLSKPDLAATDCGATTFFGSPSGGVYRFCGTSEAAPHAAAVAAIERGLNPSLTPAQVKQSQQSTARAVGAYTSADVGSGLIDALAATDAVTSRLTVTTSGSGSVKSADGRISCPTVCAASVPLATTETLVATPGAQTAVTWKGCDSISGTTCTVGLAADRSVTATFTSDTTAPSASLSGKSDRLQLSRKVRLSWHGSDGGSGVASYTVSVAKQPARGKAGAFTPIASLTQTTATSAKLKVRYGARYCYRVTATDVAGNVSPPSITRCLTLPVDDRQLKASHGWKRSHGPTPSHTLSTTSRHGATLTLTKARGIRFGMIARTCRQCGTATLSFKGKPVATVDLRSKTQKTVVVLSKPLRKVATGALVLTVTSKHHPVQVDGLVVAATKRLPTGRAFGLQP